MKSFKQEFQHLIKLYKKKNFSKAELLNKRLINIYPNNILLYNILGLILNEQNKMDEAIDCYERGLKIDPNFAMFYNNLGTIFKSKEQYDKAESYYKKSIDLDNKLPEPQNNLGNLYKFLNKYKEAIGCYKKAISINPNFFAFHYNLAVAYKSTGVFDKAKNHFEKCIRLKQDFYTAHRNLSELIKYNNEDKHFIFLEKLYENNEVIKKNKKELAFALGKAYEDMNNFDKAFKFFFDKKYPYSDETTVGLIPNINILLLSKYFAFKTRDLLNFSIFSNKLSDEKNTNGCFDGISFNSAGDNIAGAVFFLNGSNIILYFFILCFKRYFFTKFR